MTREPFAFSSRGPENGTFRVAQVVDLRLRSFLRDVAAMQYPAVSQERWWAKHTVKLNRARKFASIFGEISIGLLRAFYERSAFVLVNLDWRLADEALCRATKGCFTSTSTRVFRDHMCRETYFSLRDLEER